MADGKCYEIDENSSTVNTNNYTSVYADCDACIANNPTPTPTPLPTPTPTPSGCPCRTLNPTYLSCFHARRSTQDSSWHHNCLASRYNTPSCVAERYHHPEEWPYRLETQGPKNTWPAPVHARSFPVASAAVRQCSQREYRVRAAGRRERTHTDRFAVTSGNSVHCSTVSVPYRSSGGICLLVLLLHLLSL